MDVPDEWSERFAIGDDWAISLYADVISDRNPLHHDSKAARAAGLRGIIAPGAMLMGFVSSAIASKLPLAMVRRVEFKFAKPLYAGAQPLVQCKIREYDSRRITIDILVMDDTTVAARGSCLLFPPRPIPR